MIRTIQCWSGPCTWPASRLPNWVWTHRAPVLFTHGPKFHLRSYPTSTNLESPRKHIITLLHTYFIACRLSIRRFSRKAPTMAAAAARFPPLLSRPVANTICLFDVDGTLTPARQVAFPPRSSLYYRISMGLEANLKCHGLGHKFPWIYRMSAPRCLLYFRDSA